MSSDSHVTFALAFFLGMFLQTLFVGVFIPLLILAIYAQWKKVSRGRKVNWLMAFTTVFFGLTITTHWVLGVRRSIIAALYLPPGLTAEEFFQPPYSLDEIARRGIFQFQIVVGDLILLYRMYHIYDKNLLVCIIPAITIATSFAVGCGLTNRQRNLNTPAQLAAFDHWMASCFSVTLFNNTFMSACAALRLWKVHKETAMSNVNAKDSIILRAIRVLVESAALWTFFVILNFFTFLAGSNLKYTFLSITCPAVGISFCFIIVRLGAISAEVREDSWQSSQRSRTLPVTSSRHSKVPLSLDRIKVERDVYVSETESGVVEFRMISPTSPCEKSELPAQ